MDKVQKCRICLERHNIDIHTREGMSLFCCAYAFCEGFSKKVGDIVSWYAAFGGYSVRALNAQLRRACAQAKCGYTPGRLMRLVAKEVSSFED